jgi:hypothetical protein
LASGARSAAAQSPKSQHQSLRLGLQELKRSELWLRRPTTPSFIFDIGPHAFVWRLIPTHQAYGVPRPIPTPEFLRALETTLINPDGLLAEPLPISQAAEAVGKLDNYKENETDQADMERQWPQLKGQFLIDRDGFVRWANIECAADGLAGVGKFPSANEILAAAHSLAD